MRTIKKTAKRRGPPFARGIKPLFDAGLIGSYSDDFVKFLGFCERAYCDGGVLRTALLKLGVDVEEVLAVRNRPSLTTPNGPGHHRKVFDEWYVRIATETKARRALQELERTPPKTIH
jgi:hypothetical protein